MIFDLPLNHPLSYVQIIGYVGMALGIFAFSQKSDVRLKLSMVAMTSVLVIHFVLLGRFVAAVSATSAGLRAGLSLVPFVMRHRHYFAVVFAVLTIILGVYSYARWFDILPFITALMGTFGFFYLSGIWLRINLLIGGVLWFGHNILALSYGPAVMEFVMFIANAITIYRLSLDVKKPQSE